MWSTNANNETWYMLRYDTDFTPWPAAPAVQPWQQPSIDPTLLWDRARHVLELRPTPGGTPATPPPGIAVDPDGEVVRSDPAGYHVWVTRCDGTRRDLVREPGTMIAPAGLAIDRRGFVYVADPGARRVLVALPDDGSVQGVLVEGLVDPVDVAVTPNVTILVADRAGGKIVRYGSHFSRLGEFAPRNAAGLPATPQPIAVMVDADGSVLVADATYPFLLHFDVDGTPLADVDLGARLRAISASGIALDALSNVYGGRMPRFLAGACSCPPIPGDGGAALAAMALDLRILALHLDASFATSGAWTSAALDGGVPGVIWDKVVIDADVPPGCSITVDAEALDKPSALATFASNETQTTPPLTGPLDRLLFTPAGRYLRLRLTLNSNAAGTATPTIRAVKVFYPRVSYIDLLPRVYQRNPAAASFLTHFLALFEHVLTGVEDRYEGFSRDLDPASSPANAIDWLASLVDLAFDPSWSLARKRLLLENIIDLYRMRGTIAGIERYVEIYTGVRPLIVEGFLERQLALPSLGVQGSLLGSTTLLAATRAGATAEAAQSNAGAHTFTVYVYSSDACDDSVLLSVVDRIVATTRPAHTAYTLRLVEADARVGTVRVGLDAVLGLRGPEGTQLGGCPEPGAPTQGTGVLGVDSVLGDVRPEYVRPTIPRL